MNRDNKPDKSKQKCYYEKSKSDKYISCPQYNK